MRRLMLLLLAAVWLASPACAAELRVGLTVEPDSIDPHFHNFGGNKSLMPNLFEALTTMDAQDRLVPALAVSWRLIDDATWEFKLREGVTFSDGTKLTADDVAFTIERVTQRADDRDGHVGIRESDRARGGDRSADGTNRTPRGRSRWRPNIYRQSALFPGRMARVRARPTTTPVRRPSAPDRSAWLPGRAPIDWCWRGTTAWWGGRVAWDRVTFRYIKNPASRLAALLAGDAELIDQVSVQDVARVKEDARFTVASGLSDDIVGFVFDQQDRSSPKITDNDGKPLSVRSIPRQTGARAR